MLYPLIPLQVEKAWELMPTHLKSEDAVYKLGWFQPKEEWRNEEVADLIRLLNAVTDPTQLIMNTTLKRRYLPFSIYKYKSDGLVQAISSKFLGGACIYRRPRLSIVNHISRATRFPHSNARLTNSLLTEEIITRWRRQDRRGNAHVHRVERLLPREIECPWGRGGYLLVQDRRT